MTRNPVWLEVALNGPWARERQPLIPITEEEVIEDGIACARAGAAIVHLHAYDPATGRQKDDAAIYARIIRGIRAAVDAIVYPTVPLAGSTDAPEAGAASARYAAVEELAREGLIEWAVVDPGSTQMSFRADLEQDRPGVRLPQPGIACAPWAGARRPPWAGPELRHLRARVPAPGCRPQAAAVPAGPDRSTG